MPFLSCRWLLLWPILLPLVAGLSCAVRKDKTLPKLTPFETSASGGQVYLAEVSRATGIDGSTLAITRLAVSKLKVGRRLVAKVSFSADGRADQVTWQVCPKGATGACQQGATSLSDALFADLPSGRYGVSVKACVYSERALEGTNLCGPTQYAEWDELQGVDLQATLLVSELLAKEKELQAYGGLVHKGLSDFKAALATCRAQQTITAEDAAAARDAITAQVETQIENMLNLGPAFLGYSLQGLNTDGKKEEDELAAILAPEILMAVDPLSSESGEASYQPAGYSLATTSARTPVQRWQVLKQFYGKRVVRYTGKSSLIPQLAAHKALLASSGLLTQDQTLQLAAAAYRRFTHASFSLLGSRQKLGAISGVMLLAGGAFLGFELATDFAGFAALNALFAGAEVADPGSCMAYTQAASNLAAIKTRVGAIKDRLQELKTALGES